MIFIISVNHIERLSEGNEVIDSIHVEPSRRNPDAQEHIKLELLEQREHQVLAVWLLTLQDLDVRDGDEHEVLDALLHNLLSKVHPCFPLTAGEQLAIDIAYLVEPEVRIDDLDQTEADHEAADSNLEVFNGIVEVHVDANHLLIINQIVALRVMVHVNGQEPLIKLRNNLCNNDEANGAAEDGAEV